MVQVNAIGDACPIPVIKTLHALQDLNGAGTVQTLVDNEIAVQNLTRLAESKGCSITTEFPPTIWARAMRNWAVF